MAALAAPVRSRWHVAERRDGQAEAWTYHDCGLAFDFGMYTTDFSGLWCWLRVDGEKRTQLD
jgi:hypothetical protein